MRALNPSPNLLVAGDHFSDIADDDGDLDVDIDRDATERRPPLEPTVPQQQRLATGRRSSLGRMFRNPRASRQIRLSDASSSLKDSLGLPGVAKAKAKGSKEKPRDSIPEEATAVVVPWQDSQQRLPRGPPAVSSAVQGVLDVEECLSWVRPRKLDGGFLSSLARLGVEIDHLSREWHSKRKPREVVEDMPHDPMHTAQASSFLIRVVRSLPVRMPLRSMMEPLLQVILRSMYCEWSWVPSVDDIPEDGITVESMANYVPFYALVRGHQGISEKAKTEAVAAVSEAEQLRSTTSYAVKQLEGERQLAQEYKDKFEAEHKDLTDANQVLKQNEETIRKLRQDLRTAQSDCADVDNKLNESKDEVRDMKRESKQKDGTIADLRNQVQKLTANGSRLEDENSKMRAKLDSQKAEIDQMPKLKEQLDKYESDEAIHGVQFAARVSKDVLGLDLEEICGLSETQLTRRASMTQGGSAQKSSTGQMKWVLDTVASKLRSLPKEINSLKVETGKLHRQVADYRQLIPIWNKDAMEDFEDAYNQDAPVHRQIFSMKDRRSFAGLGTGEDVPLYLRTEGMVRHIFVSKGELEDFMEEFTGNFFDNTNEHDMSTQAMHSELYQHIKLRFQDKKEDQTEALFEFAYAFICSLEAYRDDPDFELFDLMLSGAVHPSIMKDQKEMMQNLETLTRSCQEAAGEPQEKGPQRKKNAAAVADQKEQVSRKIIRAALEVVFPDKTPERHDALRKALHVTIQQLSDAAKTPAPDYVYTSDLFAATADGSQTPLVEEIRRQHVDEVIEWTAELTRRCLDGRNIEDKLTTIHEKKLQTIIGELDTHCTPVQAAELTKIGLLESKANVLVRDVLRRLRHGVLLRPRRLWIRSEPKEVVARLLVISRQQQESGRASVDENADEQTQGGLKMPQQRIRALKVVDNPKAMMDSDEHSDPDKLEKMIRMRGSGNEGKRGTIAHLG